MFVATLCYCHALWGAKKHKKATVCAFAARKARQGKARQDNDLLPFVGVDVIDFSRTLTHATKHCATASPFSRESIV